MAMIDKEGVADRLAIQQVLAEHSRGLDRADAELLGGCYWPGATVDYGMFKGPAADFVPLVVGALQQGYALTRHSLSNTLFQFEGDSCRCESLVTAQHLSPGRNEDVFYSGRYLDLLRREGNEWRLQHRQVVSDWVRNITFENLEDSPQYADLSRGQHDRRDPSYALFGETS